MEASISLDKLLQFFTQCER